MSFSLDEDLWFGDADGDDEAEARAAQSMIAKAAKVYGARPFPAAAQRLAEITSRSDASVGAAVKVLEKDAALSASLLRLVNSASYALAVPCKSVRHAAAIVGLDPLNWLAVVASVTQMFDVEKEAASRIMEHSGAVASVCRYLAPLCGLDAQEMFTCGFMHDIGKLMFLDSDDGSYRQMLDEVAGEDHMIHEMEREQFGFDHAVLGAHVLKAWAIPDPVPRVVAQHHHFEAAAAGDARVAAMAALVRFSDAICCRVLFDDDEGLVEEIADLECAHRIGISEPQLDAIWDDLVRLAGGATSTIRGEAGPHAALASTTSNEDVGPDSPQSRGFEKDATAGDFFDGRAEGLLMKPEVREVMSQVDCEVCGDASFASSCMVCGCTACPSCLEQDWCRNCVVAFEQNEQAIETNSTGHVTKGAGIGLLAGAGLWSAMGMAAATMWIVPASGVALGVGWMWLARAASRAAFHRDRTGRKYFDEGWKDDLRWRVSVDDLVETERRLSGEFGIGADDGSQAGASQLSDEDDSV